MSNFDELMEMHEDEDSNQRDFKPLWKINTKNKEEVHTWLKNEFKYLLSVNK